MKVRMILGEYEDQEPDSLDIFLEPVCFPMEVAPVDERQIPKDGEYVTLTTEEELHQWASTRFAAYNIWDMEVPEGAILRS